jgi:hypothetical protein
MGGDGIRLKVYHAVTGVGDDERLKFSILSTTTSFKIRHKHISTYENDVLKANPSLTKCPGSI